MKPSYTENLDVVILPFLDLDFAAGVSDFPATVRSVTSLSSFDSGPGRFFFLFDEMLDFFSNSFFNNLFSKEVE